MENFKLHEAESQSSMTFRAFAVSPWMPMTTVASQRPQCEGGGGATERGCAGVIAPTRTVTHRDTQHGALGDNAEQLLLIGVEAGVAPRAGVAVHLSNPPTPTQVLRRGK